MRHIVTIALLLSACTAQVPASPPPANPSSAATTTPRKAPPVEDTSEATDDEPEGDVKDEPVPMTAGDKKSGSFDAVKKCANDPACH